jgi:hypothetical protein
MRSLEARVRDRDVPVVGMVRLQDVLRVGSGFQLFESTVRPCFGRLMIVAKQPGEVHQSE